MKDRLIKKFEDELATLNHELKLELPKERAFDAWRKRFAH